MNSPVLETLLANYRWDLSLMALVGYFALEFVLKRLVLLVPAFKAEHQRNVDTFKAKMQKPNYAANQAWNRKWGLIFLAAIYILIAPFILTLDAQPWWRYPTDLVVILMVYDFFYYLTHRFLFHDSGFLGGPLKWVHTVHHRQHNPCRMDSSYIHPIEVAMGLGLYIATVAGLTLIMGKFHVATFVVTWVAHSQINLHNHDRWETDRFPFKYLSTISVMHHNHHAKFTGGNFATITLLFDWMFGTLDYGDERKAKATVTAQAEA